MHGLRRWFSFASSPFCPEWFKPSFTSLELFDRKTRIAVSRFIAQRKNRWEAIEFDNLYPLFDTANKYLNDYLVVPEKF
jgi:hypothetical protein